MGTLFKHHGLLPLACIVFLNTAIDLGHKIIIQNTIFKIYDGSMQVFLAAIVNALILLPYILFFLPAGKTSDRYSKPRVIRFTSLSALLITLLISICYYLGWFWPAFALTFILAVQSCWFGPAKYGLLKELVPNQDLASANGLLQACVTTGILSSMLVFSILFESLFPDRHELTTILQAMTPLALVLVAISLVEIVLSFSIPDRSLAEDKKELRKENSGLEELKNLCASDTLFPAVIGLCVFWSIGQMLLAIYPAYAKAEMQIENTIIIQGLLATIGLGIITGSWVAARFSRHHIEMAFIPVAGAGVIISSLSLPMTSNIYLAFIQFYAIGIIGACLVVPLNSIIQFCSHPHDLGKMIANSNLFQNVFMLLALCFTMLAALYEYSSRQMLFGIVIFSVSGIGYLLYRYPVCFTRIIHPTHKPLVLDGFNEVIGYGDICFSIQPEKKHIDLLQVTFPRPLHLIEETNDFYLLASSDKQSSSFTAKYQVSITENNNSIQVQFTKD